MKYRMDEDNSTKSSGQPGSKGAGPSLEALLRQAALGLAPVAPRLPQPSMTNQQFGGYQKGYTATRGFKGTLSFAMLRQLSQRSPLLSAIVTTRLHQINRYTRPASQTKRNEVGFRIVHKRHHDKDFNVPQGFKDKCRELEEMFQKPWRVFWDEGHVYRDVEPTLASFLSKVTEDYLVINRPAIELGLDSSGVPRAFGAIDGANVIPTFAALKYLATRKENKDMPKDFGSNYNDYKRSLQMISDKYDVNINEKTEWIYLLYGKPAAAFRYDELIVAPFAPQSDIKQTGYPRSLTERAVFIILAEIMAMTANSRYFEFGSMAESIVALKGNYDDTHVKEIQDIFQANMSGVQGMYRIPLLALPGGADDLNVVQIKQNHRDMLFDVYIQKLTNLACAVFRMHPSEINEAPRAGDNSGALTQSSQTKQISMAQEQGLETALLHHKQTIFDPILERIEPDAMFEWDHGENEQEQLTIIGMYGTITKVNERRQMLGLDPLTPEEGGDVVDNQFIMQKKQMDQQQEQMKQQEAAQAQQPQPGGDDGEQQPQPDDEEEPDQGDETPPEEEDEEPQQKRKGAAGGKGFVKRTPWSKEDEDAVRRIAALQR